MKAPRWGKQMRKKESGGWAEMEKEFGHFAYCMALIQKRWVTGKILRVLCLYRCVAVSYIMYMFAAWNYSVGFLSSCCNISELKSIYFGNRKLVIFVKAPGDDDSLWIYHSESREGRRVAVIPCAVNSQRLKPQLLPVPTPEVTPWRPHQIRAVAFGLKGERTN